MMEFVLSRVTMSVCALLLLAALAPILVSVNDDAVGRRAAALAERFDALLSDVSASNVTVTLQGSEMLPKGWTMDVSDGYLTLKNGERHHVHKIQAPLRGDPIVLDRDGCYRISPQMSDGEAFVHLEKVETRSSTASPSLAMSSWSL